MLRVDDAVAKRKGEERKFSLNDWIVEAIRAKVDGGDARAYGMLPNGDIVLPVKIDPAGAFGRKRTAAELAASIPGVRVGMGENFFDAGDAPVEDVVLFDWDKQFAKWASHGEEGDREMTEYFQEHRVEGGFWKQKTKAGRLLWCKENLPEGPK